MSKTPSHKGFTLLEVLVAITILAVGIISIMQLFSGSLRQVRLASERTSVASIANTELSRVKAGGVGNQLQHWAAQNALNSLGAASESYELYSSWRSSVVRVGGDVDLFRVTFTVEMFDGREEKFVTYVTQQ